MRGLTRLFRRRRGSTAIDIEYSPSIDGDPDPGEVVWAWVPYEEDPQQGKDRPIAVIGHRRGTLIGVPLTTKHDSRDPQFELGSGPWDPQRRTSYARLDRLIELDPTRMRREGAIIDRKRFDRLVAALERYQRAHASG